MNSDTDHLRGELTEIQARYSRRGRRTTRKWKIKYYERARAERNRCFSRIINDRFSASALAKIRFLEVGAGRGENLEFFHRMGIRWNQMYANDLLEDRVEELRSRFSPELNVLPGDALEVKRDSYDLILVSTVFSSILDSSFRRRLATHLLDLLSEDGLLLWYDFVLPNPLNPDVREIRKGELCALFRDSPRIQTQPVTLYAPVALMVGPLYSVFSRVPFLRSHLVAAIDKPRSRTRHAVPRRRTAATTKA